MPNPRMDSSGNARVHLLYEVRGRVTVHGENVDA